MCRHDGFCIAYQSDFTVSLAMLNTPFTENGQLRNKPISDKADASVWCTQELIRIAESRVFIQSTGRKEPFI